MTDSKSTLQEFGLTEKEASVYLMLIKSGSSTANEIASKTKVHRVNLYDILERLQKKGLVSYVILGKRKHYEASEPKKILELEEERKQKIHDLILELNSERVLEKSGQEATIYKDKKGIRAILEEIPKSETEVYLFASGWGFRENFPEYTDIWHAQFKANKTKIKCLISNKFKNIEIPKPLEYKYLPSEFVFPSTTIIYENNVLIIMWGIYPLAILIKGKEIAESYKEFFQILWKTVKN